MTNQKKEINEIFRPGRFSRQSEVAPELPFSVSTMWRRINEGTFPKPIKLSEKVTAFRNDDLNLWFSEPSAKFDGDV